tara:strand:- start:61 stop:333 length:273 start_codon:yes stop_codon:yes gene_type:complete
MLINRYIDFRSYEIIGLKISIISSSDTSLQNITGIVINETKNTFQLRSNNKIKTIQKLGNVFLFHEHNIEIPGKYLIGRPEERLAKVRKL